MSYELLLEQQVADDMEQWVETNMQSVSSIVTNGRLTTAEMFERMVKAFWSEKGIKAD